MEFTLNLRIDMTPAVVKALGFMMKAAGYNEPFVPEDTKKAEPAEAEPAEAEPAEVTKEEAQPEQAPEPAAQAEPEEYKERPEDVLPLLRQRFGIPEDKDARDDEQTAKAKALAKGVRSVIRMVTKNGEARAITDLRTDDDKKAFIATCLEHLYYNINSGEFEIRPF